MTHSFLPEYEQYMLELRDFYAPHFPSLEDADIFIQNAIQLDWDDRKPRQMLFQVQLGVELYNFVQAVLYVLYNNLYC